MQLSIIVAFDDANGIGANNCLLCRLSKDLKNFKELTIGYPIIMGRKTFHSLPHGALPNRTNIVISKTIKHFEGCITCKSVEEVLELPEVKNAEKCFVIGGASIYKQFFDKASKLYVTRIRHTFENADVFFPEIDVEDTWRIVSVSEEFPADEKNEYPFFFAVYERI
ncbi:MAG: dihydrofolate reductase [Bacteroidales bacterium]|nr:dihydrofolate reductase [Bacteroidales bacterium]